MGSLLFFVFFTTMIDLKNFYTDKPLNSVKHSTLLKRLDILEVKYCKECNIRLKFNSSTWWASTYCPTCVKKIKVTNMKKTVKKKYWVSNISQLEEIQVKIKQNNIKKYWVSNTSKLESIKSKIRETNFINHWVFSTSSLKTTKDKIKQTNILKYWKDSFLQTEKARLARKNLSINKILAKDSNINILDKWYKYKCDICNKISKYITFKNKAIFLQRVRLWFLPCQHCIPSSWAWINSRSTIEIQLDKAIQELWVKTEHKKNIDIFLPDFNLWIEVNWIYWHSDKFKDKNYHKNKIIKNDINLLFFTDYELLNNFETILNYIKWKIWLLPAIWASKCKIKNIWTLEAKNFCNKYHIHWFSSWSKYYWMFFKDSLVSVCIVWKNRFSKDWIEIIRLANKTKIIWWFARFLKRIKNDFKNYNKIITFIDAYLWDNLDNVFTRNWFSYISHTTPNYNWFINRWKTKLSRYQCMKHKLLKKWYKWETEDEIMKWLWWIKVYDWWNYKFELLY